MKQFFILQTLILMWLNNYGQNTVYSKDGKQLSFQTEKLDINFVASPSKILFPDNPNKIAQNESAALLALIPMAVDFAFKTTTKILDKNVKKFSAEYTKQRSNLLAYNKQVPDFTFKRIISLDGSTDLTALSIEFASHRLNDQPLYYYTINKIELEYSAAKSNKQSKKFDYSLELKLIYFVNGKKEVVELSPLVISSVGYGLKDFSKNPTENRTDFIPLTSGAIMTEVSLKIIETNPQKVRAEKILALWNDQKDNARTIVNNFFPEAKGDGQATTQGSKEKNGENEKTKETEKDKEASPKKDDKTNK